ncbi:MULTISPECIES: ABC transporter ATP-binding protein [Paenibacillus]|jgi:ABC-2 type transport system ATP-binding protein|uniref:Multidrug ABC transporter ATP-binding protein n=1 Tax=Paenibacillus odorifer TaxID=189426 RepID=A0A1R0WU87_9BACL|nr:MULTISPECIES: ABC transporter ATP-binding protein [Paenibacillus]ETT66050.1 ABC transporter ATP-binding protein [Paenibacillus sp. FSL H8-237]MEC0133554.1 ABC transporter ATP-binding protein [Paenibacillus odorifer]MEC0224873.1 ABC transporter ATP-binding protein [Paenibacillus odorifer]OMC96563.1 multidrug ABC transporter ATP-binding protein [Paenibacillus odorifer]OMD03909.1 multidrug ABC transporter ATP-binding protein [Paenibacillus odorifer]
MIQVNQMVKNYGFKKVLNGVSFTAAKGEITCLIGINGAGKSTVLKSIMGLTPYKGEVLIDNVSLTPVMYEKITFIPDSLTMPSNMRIADCLIFMADFYRNWNAERAKELLKFFQLSSSDRVSSLSKGMAAKVNLLLGLALDCDYILMDEPFSGIDMFSREQITDVFTSELIEDRGVIITTHEINDIEHLIDKAVLLQHGKVEREFYCEEVREQEGKSITDVMREVYMK